MFSIDRVRNQFQAEFESLRAEVHKLADIFTETSFLGDVRNFPHAHYGYLMACMGRVDQYSAFWKGTVPKDGTDQTQRMVDFLAEFVYPLPEHAGVHSVAVKMFRHVLMHTGALRFAFDEVERVAYTWRINFGKLPATIKHYTISAVDARYEDRLLQFLPQGIVLNEVRSINLSIALFVTGIYGGVSRYVAELRDDATLQENYLKAERAMVFQNFKHKTPSVKNT